MFGKGDRNIELALRRRSLVRQRARVGRTIRGCFKIFTTHHPILLHHLSIEASTTNNWDKYVGKYGKKFGINDFGKSAPYKDIYKFYGLTSENISKEITKLIKKK